MISVRLIDTRINGVRKRTQILENHNRGVTLRIEQDSAENKVIHIVQWPSGKGNRRK